jgi:aldehyde:ferredoxin oxidoreductase
MDLTTCGYWGTLLWIDLTTQTFKFEQRPEAFFRHYAGGGLLATALLLERTRPGIDPLGPENLLVFTSSVVAGHPGAGLPRFTVAAKSPLTGGIGETRCEGPWGVALKASGADAIILTGESTEPVAVVIGEGRVEFLPADDLWGLTVGETTDHLEALLGNDVHVAAIGPAGEARVRFASIVSERTYQAARMGMGAVMGAKRVKAIVIREGDRPALADADTVSTLTESFTQRIAGNDLSRWQQEAPGFSCWLYLHGLDAALDVNNYACPMIEGTEKFKAKEFLQRYSGDGCCPGCPNNCIKYMHPLNGEDLDPRASGIHQEVTGAMGPNLGIVNLDWILRANNLANQYGLDPTSLGFTISFAMELYAQGILTEGDGTPVHFGDTAGAERLLLDIVYRRGLGDVLAEGTKRAAAQISRGAQRYAMHVKGLEMVCFEPRSQTNLAMGYAVAPIGPRYDICEHDWDFDTTVGWDHTLNLSRTIGVTRRIPMGYQGADKVRYFKALNNLWSAADALDLCIFAIAPTRILSLPEMARMLAAVTGWQTSDYEIMRIGERRNHLMRWYNMREGLTAADDTLPARFFEEPIVSGPCVGDVLNHETFHRNIVTYYRMMGWTDEGCPTEATLLDHDLQWVMQHELVEEY